MRKATIASLLILCGSTAALANVSTTATGPQTQNWTENNTATPEPTPMETPTETPAPTPDTSTTTPPAADEPAPNATM